MRKTLFISLSVALLLSACNTMQGLGRDIELMGDSLQSSAEKNKYRDNSGTPRNYRTAPQQTMPPHATYPSTPAPVPPVDEQNNYNSY